MAEHLPEICDELIRKAEKGDLATIKLLTQLAGLDKGSAQPVEESTALVRQVAYVRKTLKGMTNRPHEE